MEWAKDDRGLVSSDKQGQVIGWNLFPYKSKEGKQKEGNYKVFEFSNKGTE